MSAPTDVTRRDFVATGAGAGAALLVGFWLPGVARPLERLTSTPSGGSPSVAPFEPNAWLRIDQDGTITFHCYKSEMGQGVWTALPMLVAEELDADWRHIKVERAPIRSRFGDPNTGGSDSIKSAWLPMRRAGAAARLMLVGAAAKRWAVKESECTTKDGEVLHSASGRRVAYGDLVAEAATMPVPDMEKVPLKDPKNFRLIGRATSRLDAPLKVNGAAKYGLDVRVPGMLVAAVERGPTLTAKIARYDESAARAVPGVRRVIALEPHTRAKLPARVAVLADDTYAAMRGRRALAVQWADAENDFASEPYRAKCLSLAGAQEFTPVSAKGDVAGILQSATRTFEATYEQPYLAHATMEPANCTAHVHDGRCEIWAPTQYPMWAIGAAANQAGVEPRNVDINVTFMGGGFGRRINPDFVIEAVQLSKAAGVPVQVVWTREDDVRHDFYRPAGVQRLTAALDSSGRPIAWRHRLVGPSTRAFYNPEARDKLYEDEIYGAGVPYAIPNHSLEFVYAPSPIALGWWRGVAHTQNTFATESFIDELAHHAKADPLDYRRRLIDDSPRLARVLEIAAERSGWGKPLPRGRGRGVAINDYGGTMVAEVAEVTVTGDEVRVDRVTVAFDCGQVVNPSIVAAQVEGGVAWGLSAALHEEITAERGRVRQGNFHEYQLLRFAEMPVVDVHIVPSAEAPTGVGEPPVPPIMPAVTNAIFAATGRRVRRLPVRLSSSG
ncbi:MAG TPA: xanthine dehydrogenase family protein molybdopterin-binding subunit [Gemmatimonadaceae bacterium]|nr:xanthine dehydrogenase family protein molybdopterin-binding subunit [Gemmatimonadaceae bacterium]